LLFKERHHHKKAEKVSGGKGVGLRKKISKSPTNMSQHPVAIKSLKPGDLPQKRYNSMFERGESSAISETHGWSIVHHNLLKKKILPKKKERRGRGKMESFIFSTIFPRLLAAIRRGKLATKRTHQSNSSTTWNFLLLRLRSRLSTDEKEGKKKQTGSILRLLHMD